MSAGERPSEGLSLAAVDTASLRTARNATDSIARSGSSCALRSARFMLLCAFKMSKIVFSFSWGYLYWHLPLPEWELQSVFLFDCHELNIGRQTYLVVIMVESTPGAALDYVWDRLAWLLWEGKLYSTQMRQKDIFLCQSLDVIITWCFTFVHGMDSGP